MAVLTASAAGKVIVSDASQRSDRRRWYQPRTPRTGAFRLKARLRLTPRPAAARNGRMLNTLLCSLLAAAPTAVALPGGPPVTMDCLAYDAKTDQVWVPAGNTGNVDVLEVLAARGAGSRHMKYISGPPLARAARLTSTKPRDW